LDSVRWRVISPEEEKPTKPVLRRSAYMLLTGCRWTMLG
jgi:hypothetical protein